MNEKIPVLFVGHGSPMNAIEDNEYSRAWAKIGAEIKRPRVILSISAHWYTSGTKIMDTSSPRLVYDMYGFPDELYKVTYPVKGSPGTARHAIDLIKHAVRVDNSWGIDHGTWSVLRNMFPEADIPVLQLSVDSNSDAAVHYRIGKEIASLRNSGVMIMGSGNVVHNLARINWEMKGGNSWAVDFDKRIKDSIMNGKHEDVIQYDDGKMASKLAFPTPEHFYPLLYVLGASDPDDRLTVFNEACTMGSLSMTSYLFE